MMLFWPKEKSWQLSLVHSVRHNKTQLGAFAVRKYTSYLYNKIKAIDYKQYY